MRDRTRAPKAKSLGVSILIILVGSFFGAFPALAGSALLAPATVLAGTDCAVYNTAPATDGLAVRA
jgi:hypothetical protein